MLVTTTDEVLDRHVRESNLIEGIAADPGNPLYDCHFAAAQLVARGELVHPSALHKTLCEGVPLLRGIAGNYRQCEVLAGANPMPRPVHVPELMHEWWGVVQSYASDQLIFGGDLVSDADNAAAAFGLHSWFLCIHPHLDGNGRTARLVHNMLRLARGLPWQVTMADTKDTYIWRIRTFEKVVFKRSNPEVYSKEYDLVCGNT